MTTELAAMNQELLSSIVLNGDLSKLNPMQLMQYYGYRCKQLGLDPSSQPFGILVLKGKKVLYPNKGCAEQLNKIYKISHVVVSTETVKDVYIVRVRASMPDGQHCDNVGAVNIAGLTGDELANAIMKSETKGHRRSTLSLLGLGMTDETEIETIKGAQTIQLSPEEMQKALDIPTDKKVAQYQLPNNSPTQFSQQVTTQIPVVTSRKPEVAQEQTSGFIQETPTPATTEEKKNTSKGNGKTLYVKITEVFKKEGGAAANMTCTHIRSNKSIRATVWKNSFGKPNPIYDQIDQGLIGTEATLNGYFRDSTNAQYPEPSFFVTSFFKTEKAKDQGIAEDVPALNNDVEFGDFDNKSSDIPF